jgi:hypothetical protein
VGVEERRGKMDPIREKETENGGEMGREGKGARRKMWENCQKKYVEGLGEEEEERRQNGHKHTDKSAVLYNRTYKKHQGCHFKIILQRNRGCKKFYDSISSQIFRHK